MVLQDVTKCTRLFVECATPLNTNRLRHGDLDVIDVASVPEWLKDQVAESEDQDVADGLLSEVVINAVHLTLAEDLAHFTIELYRRIKISSKRLLDDDAAPATLARLVIKPCGTEAADDLWK